MSSVKFFLSFPSLPTSNKMISALSCFAAKYPVGKLSGQLTGTEQPRVLEGAIVSSTAKLFPSEIVERGVSAFFNVMLRLVFLVTRHQDGSTFTGQLPLSSLTESPQIALHTLPISLCTRIYR